MGAHVRICLRRSTAVRRPWDWLDPSGAVLGPEASLTSGSPSACRPVTSSVLTSCGVELFSVVGSAFLVLSHCSGDWITISTPVLLSPPECALPRSRLSCLVAHETLPRGRICSNWGDFRVASGSSMTFQRCVSRSKPGH